MSLEIVAETINRIRLSDGDLILLNRVLRKLDTGMLDVEERKFYEILLARVAGRLKLKGLEVEGAS